MEFNPDPTKQATELLFSCKKNKIDHPPLIFNNQIVKKVEYQKHLGLILDSNLSFVDHINAKIALAKKNVGIIRHLSNHLPMQVLSQMYKVFIRSHLDYCDFIYHIPPIIRNSPLEISLNFLMESIEKVQYMSALAVTGAWRGSNRSKLYEEIGWETLSDRRMYRRLLQLYKITNSMTPEYLRNKLPPKKDLICTVIMRLFSSVNFDVIHQDTLIAFFLTLFLHGTEYLETLISCRLLANLNRT